MISVTGRGARIGANPAVGFTLIELLVVITILMVLMGLVFVIAGNMKRKANIAATQSLIEQIQTLAGNYRSRIGAYPADGIDSPLETAGGTELRSGAALAHALVLPIKIRKKEPGGKYRLIDQPPLGEFGEREVIRPFGDDDPDAVEFVDAWGEPLHYDNLEGADSFSEQGEDSDVHLSIDAAEIDHGADPREDPEAVRTTGPQNPNQFDVWSHGHNGHEEDESPHEAIANFIVLEPGNQED